MEKSLLQSVPNGITRTLQSDPHEEHQFHIPSVISYNTDRTGRVSSPSDGSLIENLAQCEAMLSGVFSVHKVFKYASLVSKIRSFTKKRVICSEHNKISV